MVLALGLFSINSVDSESRAVCLSIFQQCDRRSGRCKELNEMRSSPEGRSADVLIALMLSSCLL